MTKQMNAIVINEYGGRDQLTQTQMPIPEISDHQLLVKVVSIGVNPIDWKVREGLRKKRYNFEFPIILGQEMARSMVIARYSSQHFQTRGIKSS